jgi:nucleoside-diphosphate-sugar epimerase
VSATTLIVGCGYLGTRVAAQLVQRGERVLGTVRSPARGAVLRSQGIEPVIADVLDPDSLRTLPPADRAFYCVGYDRASGTGVRGVTVDGLRNALGGVAGRVGRLVYASSTGVYGPGPEDAVDEDSPTLPSHDSGRATLEAEDLLRETAACGGLPAIILRFAGLYGPGRVLRRASLERGEPIAGDPDRPLNLIHIADAATATVAALDRGQPGRIYLVSDDRPLPRRTYYTLAAALLGAPPPSFVPPAAGSPEALRHASSKRVSNRRLRMELGVTLAFPDVYAGLPDSLGVRQISEGTTSPPTDRTHLV